MAVGVSSLNKKKILFIVPSLSGGGSERFIYTLAKNISKEKFDVSVYVINSNNTLYKFQPKDNVRLIEGKIKRVRYSIFELLKVANKIKPDVIFSTLGYLNIYLGVFSSFFKNAKLIGRESIVIDMYFNDERNVKSPKILKFLYNFAYPKLDLLVCQSQDMYQSFINEKINLPKTVIINNPINVEEVIALSNLDQENKNFCFDLITIGRFNYQKGYDRMIEVMDLLVNKNNLKVSLGIIGGGENLAEIEASILAKGLENHITLLGQQTNPFPYIKNSKLFLLCSRYEGFPNVLLEAGACGKPVIAFDVPGGINEIVADKRTGHVVENGNIKLMAKTIIESLGRSYNPIDIQSITKDKYGIEKIIGEYENSILKLIKINNSLY